MTFQSAKVLLLAALFASVMSAKRTYKLEAKPMLKAPSVQKYDCRNCIFDDTLNYACLEHSIDVKVGWEIKQRWEVASDILPVAPTPSPAEWVQPDNVLGKDYLYKYRWRIQPYSVVSFNVRPNLKIDRLFQTEAQVNLDQVKSFFYFDIVYYQLALKYTYPTPAAPPAPVVPPVVSGTDDFTKSQYTFLGQNYPGKICIDFGYNTEDLLLTLKSAVNWKDCYKNLIYTMTDYSNWLGPKAQWIDFCDFTTDEDFLMYSYNPWGFNKDTGDLTMLWFLDKISNRATTTYVRRPTAAANNFYRDCFTLDDSTISTFSPKFNYYLEIIGSLMNLFNMNIANLIPVMGADTDIGKETVIDSPIIDGKARDDEQGTY